MEKKQKMRLNKKGYSTRVFGFFFVLMIFAAVFFFGTFVMHYLLYDYGIMEVQNVAGTLLNSTGQAMTNINTLSSGYLTQQLWYDLLFLVLLISLFIESTIAAIKTKESGYFSFFGFVTFGNVFLIFVLSYAVQVQGWLLNEIIYGILLVNISTPVLTVWFNYGMYIAVFWYLWLIAINQVDLNQIKDKISSNLFNRGSMSREEGRFEE